MLPIPGRKSLNGGSTCHLACLPCQHVVWPVSWPVSYRGTYSPIRRLLASEWMGIRFAKCFRCSWPATTLTNTCLTLPPRTELETCRKVQDPYP
jgi:hypothetical protein